MLSKPIKILLIEGSEEDAIIIREILKGTSKIQFQLTRVDRLKTGFKKLFTDPFDLILLDLNLPDSHGFDTFIRTYDQAPELPIIILSDFHNQETAVRAVCEGAQDYLIKGEIESRIFVRSVRYAIERKKTEVELMKTQKDLRKLMELHEKEIKEIKLKLELEMGECKLLESLHTTTQICQYNRSKINK